MNDQILTKFISTSDSHSNQSINGTKKSRNYKIKKFKGIDSSQTIDDVYENLEDYNPIKKRKVLILFDDMVADMDANKKLSPIVSELFLILFNITFIFIS